MERLSSEEFTLELKKRVDVKTKEINKEIDAKLSAKGLTRSKVAQPETSVSRVRKARSDASAKKQPSKKKKKKKTKESSPKTFEANPYGRIDGSFFSREGQESDIPKLSYDFECSQNDALREELEKERRKSKGLEEQLELLKSPRGRRGSTSKRAPQSQELAAGVLRDDVVYLEERIETRLANASKKFIDLMGQPLRDYVRYHEISNNIALVKEIKSNPSFDFDAELTDLAKDERAAKNFKTEFEDQAKSIPSLLKFERQWFPNN